jgi:hypothetical protein
MTKQFTLFKGGRKRDIYEDAKWKKRPIDMDGETTAMPDPFYDDGDDWRRDRAVDMVEQITSDPIERKIAKLMLENYTNEEIAQILDIGPTRVEWFMRKIEGWKRKEGKT